MSRSDVAMYAPTPQRCFSVLGVSAMIRASKPAPHATAK